MKAVFPLVRSRGGEGEDWFCAIFSLADFLSTLSLYHLCLRTGCCKCKCSQIFPCWRHPLPPPRPFPPFLLAATQLGGAPTGSWGNAQPSFTSSFMSCPPTAFLQCNVSGELIKYVRGIKNGQTPFQVWIVFMASTVITIYIWTWVKISSPMCTA